MESGGWAGRKDARVAQGNGIMGCLLGEEGGPAAALQNLEVCLVLFIGLHMLHILTGGCHCSSPAAEVAILGGAEWPLGVKMRRDEHFRRLGGTLAIITGLIRSTIHWETGLAGVAGCWGWLH